MELINYLSVSRIQIGFIWIKVQLKEMDAKKSSLGLWEGCASPKGSKWLADNLEAVDENVKLMLKLIEEDGDSFSKKAEMYYQKRPQLISCVDELHGQYCLLAERYYQLFKEMHKDGGLQVRAQNLSTDVEKMSRFHTPASKLGSYQSGFQGSGNSETDLTSPDSNSDLSLKTGSGSLSASLSDTDSDLFNSVNNISLSSGLLQNSVEMEPERASLKGKQKLGEVQAVPRNLLNADEEGNCDEMLGRIKEYEEELRVLNMKLKLSEEGIEKYELKVEANEVLIAELQSRLYIAHMDIEEQKSKLAAEERKVAELQELLTSYRNDVSSYEGTVGDLKSALCHVQEHLFVSVAQLESDIGNVLDQKNHLESELAENKLQFTSLESELRDCKDQMMKTETSYQAQVAIKQQELESLNAETKARDEELIQLNKSGDELKSKYEQLEAEKDDMTSLLLTLSAELNSQSNKIKELQDLLKQSDIEKDELHTKLEMLTFESMSRADASEQQINELRSQLDAKEVELDKLRDQVMEGAENKREAIRQLCFSLDHYKSGYKELCQAFIIPHRQPVSAS